MKTGLFALLVVAVGCSRAGHDSRVWAEKRVRYEALSNGVYRVSFDTPYFYGDRVRFAGENGKGTGTVADICLMEDGQVYYTIDLDDSKEMQGGVYANTIELVERPVLKAKEARTTPPTVPASARGRADAVR
jgi:hypothetical protein